MIPRTIFLFALCSQISSIPIQKPLEPFGPSIRASYQTFTTLQSATSILDSGLIAAKVFSSIAPQDPRSGFTVEDRYKSDDLTHIFVVQTFNGLQITNARANANIDKEGRLVSLGHTFFRPNSLFSVQQDDADETSFIVSQTPEMGPLEALGHLVTRLDLKYDGNASILSSSSPVSVTLSHSASPDEITANLCYITNENKDSLRLAWNIQIDLVDNWYDAVVDSSNGNLLSLVDWVSRSTFRVFPIGTNDPNSGPRELVESPEHPYASPLGWTQKVVKGQHVNFNDTRGNNVYAQNNPDGGNDYLKNYRPQSENGVFDFPLELEKKPETYADAAITNLFYWNNIMHDLLWVYGFNEVSGNFQDSNFDRGGKGNDAVIANAQDGSGKNNANFATPPDGRQPRMRMYVWDIVKPETDGDLEAGIIIHEYSHGMSTRLTGGPSNSGCLGWGEAGGMGEGWGDFFATILRTNALSTRNDSFGMGEYSAGKGIRNYKYSTSSKINPTTYAFIRKPAYYGVHAKGEVWAEMLYEMFWNLVDKNGWEADWFDVGHTYSDLSAADSGMAEPQIYGTDGALKEPKKPKYPIPAPKDPIPKPQPKPAPPQTPKAPSAGNKLALRLVIDGLKLQPCYPSFVDARDAILLADQILTKGDNSCEIWSAFAKRGLGIKARSGGSEDFTVPEECVKSY